MGVKWRANENKEAAIFCDEHTVHIDFDDFAISRAKDRGRRSYPQV